MEREWSEFNASNRKHTLSLSHWQKKNTSHSFAMYDKKIDVVEYTEQEYDSLLQGSPKVKNHQLKYIFHTHYMFLV